MTRSLEELIVSLLTWVKENILKLNLDKCHLIFSFTVNAKLKLDNITITNTKNKTKQKKKKKRKEKLLGIIFDDRMKFQYHIETCARKRA